MNSILRFISFVIIIGGAFSSGTQPAAGPVMNYANSKPVPGPVRGWNFRHFDDQFVAVIDNLLQAFYTY